ncbi:trafficking protein particle complex subunit 5, partial [Ochromonadaceae sp. CCMP2298]
MDRKSVTVRQGILDKSLIKPKTEVSLSTFALLFSEIVQYSQNRVSSVSDLEKKLEEAGYGIGQRVIELISCRDRLTRRETRIVNMLQYVSNTVWKHLFNKPADNLERSTENEDEYMIHEHAPITNTFVSVPADMGRLNCAAFLAGIIAGVLDAANF